jgi:hypothetical protein
MNLAFCPPLVPSPPQMEIMERFGGCLVGSLDPHNKESNVCACTVYKE